MKATNQLTGFIIKLVLIALFFAIAFAGEAFSQDRIIKRDNSEIKVKVLEIQEDLIKYKPFDDLEGPLRSISVSNVLRIVYENGRVENFVLVETPQRALPIQQVEVPPVQNQPIVEQNTSYYPLRVFGRVSIQIWDDEGLSEYFGNNPLYGVGIEKQVSDDFKFGTDIDFASKTKDEVTLNYLQFGAFVKYSWHPFGSKRPNVCGGLGIKGVSLKDIEDNYSEKASGIGFSALLGIEIPLGSKVILDLGWNTVWAKPDFEGEKLNLGNEIFFGGLIFNLW